MESLTVLEDCNINEKADFTAGIKQELIDTEYTDVSTKAKCLLVEDMEKGENNWISLDSRIKSEEVDLKREDEKDSLIMCGPKKLEEETKFARNVKRTKDAKAAPIKKENVLEIASSEAIVEEDEEADSIHKCPHCVYNTKRLDLFKRHLQRHKSSQDFHCAQCVYQTTRKYNLIRHVFSHKKTDLIVTYKCTNCDYKTRNSNKLKRHLKEHNRVDDEPIVYKCRECGYQTLRAFALKRHLTRHRRGAGQTNGTLLTAQFLLKGEDMEKGENNGESLDSSGCIKSEEVEFKREDEKYSKDMDKGEIDGESLDCFGFIKSEEVHLKSED